MYAAFLSLDGDRTSPLNVGLNKVNINVEAVSFPGYLLVYVGNRAE